MVAATGGAVTMHRVATVNLKAVAAANARRALANAQASTGADHAAPLRRLHTSAAAAQSAAVVAPTALSTFAGNVLGEHGFDGLTAAINGSANS
ncbi:MAG TPA: hypothetical protein VMU66_06005, partial [Gaiellales bacterium]|nr:hypothetical protein [Gaiellales bacterium]